MMRLTCNIFSTLRNAHSTDQYDCCYANLKQTLNIDNIILECETDLTFLKISISIYFSVLYVNKAVGVEKL